jgi:hypothetical protein
MGDLRIVSGVIATLADGDDVVERCGKGIWPSKEWIDRFKADLADVVVPLEDLGIDELLHDATVQSYTTPMVISPTCLRVIPLPRITTCPLSNGVTSVPRSSGCVDDFTMLFTMLSLGCPDARLAVVSQPILGTWVLVELID